MLEGTGTDNRGNSQVQKDTSEIFAWLYSVTITAAINRQIVPDLVIPNYGPDAPIPIVQLGAINPADILADLGIDRLLLVDLGLDLSAEDLYKRANRKPPMNDADRVPGHKQQPATTAPTGGALPMPFSETSKPREPREKPPRNQTTKKKVIDAPTIKPEPVKASGDVALGGKHGQHIDELLTDA